MDDLIVPEVGTKNSVFRVARNKINITETQAFLLNLVNQFSICIKMFQEEFWTVAYEGSSIFEAENSTGGIQVIWLFCRRRNFFTIWVKDYDAVVI